MLAPNAPCADASRGRPQETLPSPDLIEELIHEARYREATTLCAQRFGASLGRLCMGMLGNQAEVDEVLQEIFLAGYKGMPRYKGEGSVRAWLFGIARRQCARRLERGPRPHQELPLELASAEGSAEDSLREKQRAARIAPLLARLKPSERDALVLRFAGDLSFKEVAEILDISEASARKRASRALIRLRTELRPEDME